MITKSKIDALRSAKPSRFLVVKFSSLGDIVHCLPSVAQLRSAFPDAEIDWLIERKNKRVVEISGLDVRLIPIDTYQWRNSPGIGSAKEIAEFVWALRTDGYDCAIDFQGLLKSAFFAYLSGAPIRIGWERDFLKESVSRFFYTEVVTPRRIHIIDQQMELLKPLGIDPIWETEVPLRAPESARRSVDQKLKGLKDYVVINPGGNWPTKCWDPARYGALAERLMKDGLPVAVTWGPGEEEMVQKLTRAAGDGLRQIPTTLEELVALCEKARLFVGGDTGPMHFAAAVGTPIVSIFGPTSSDRNGPFRREDIVVERRLPCRPCYERDKCPLEHLQCMVDITVDHVYEAVKKRLSLADARIPIQTS
ncbi:MAG: glycosyltransferase family 9 protein [Acidobacteria bacterium]|nr:glycosyltransferase family 9 protein [Acidobacteriota bacterium]